MVIEGIMLGYKIFHVRLEVDPVKIDVAFQTLKDALTSAPILITHDWSQPFELMCNMSDVVIGAMLAQKKNKVIHPIYYASKTLNEDQGNHTIIENELRMTTKVRRVANHLSHLSNEHFEHEKKDIIDCFPNEQLFRVEEKEPLYADIVNYLVWIDSLGPFSQTVGYIYILLVVDNVSKWVEAISNVKNYVMTVSKFLKRNISRFGTYEAFFSNEGSHLINRIIAKFLAKYNINHKVATAYHPQTNGQAKDFNRKIKKILKNIVNSSRNDWVDHVD
ncbi:uncharacterized protein E5676_scaffold1567G00710 [Cucumis melo var. makuwa]|uniref:Integrase catalytic domain-containing protein n=1 Tax=Cucumis melo var. makuwa TaxID=1194695 RepID=A0A5D3DR65_CUCMM|nr:uncharacterized protein E6C27_scaffold4066G00010 [Cucumis melo var. makuwa]TYK26048.1 uncharacterized protein E5676_scaffold1567G00710 [Cucumis melo var. makuwa]